MSMSYSVSLPKKCCSIWPSGHGYQPVSEQEQTVSMRTRAQSTIKYDGSLKVFHLSMAGLANVTTEMGIIYKNFDKLAQTGKYLTRDIVELLQRRSTEYATLTWLVHKIYRDKTDKTDKCQENMVRLKLEELLEEMLILEKLANIQYEPSSLPDIIPNPTFNKVYSLKPNPDENIRRDDPHPTLGQVRSGSIRLRGDRKYNKFWAFYGLYILDTSDPEHAYFSISNLPVDKNGFVDPREIIKRNLLTRSNYETFWKTHLDTRDFSGVPDSSVSNIGDDLEASLAIFKKFCKATGIVKPVVDKRKVVPKQIEQHKQHKQREQREQRVVISEHIKILEDAVKIAADKIRYAIGQLRVSASKVSDARAEFESTANLAYKAEEKYNKLLTRITTRFVSKISEPALREYESAEAIWQQAKIDLQLAKESDVLASKTAQQVENSASEFIIAAIKKCIDDIIFSSKEQSDLKKILKNIIMSNKLKNILKTGILNKKISSNQIILFFSGLEYKELGIADPACCVVKPLQDPRGVDNTMQLDTQELNDSSFVPPPLFEDILDFIEKKLYPPMASSSPSSSSSLIDDKRRRTSVASSTTLASPWSGGTKRKRRMRIYSRKRHARRRRYTRRRSR